ncbi:MAG TPA: type III PLP-dependent enzyme [Terriglobales bacterium]|nr:type III PLP-dependent enzyme [Terriglobales bacterium]
MPVPSGSLTKHIDQFFEKHPPTPCVVVDLDIVRAKYVALQKLWPKANIYYAVKANPAPEIISALAELGANFDLASPGEIDLCFGLGIPSDRLSFGNTIKRESAIAKAWTDGIRLFAFDSIAELEKLARCAPGSRVFCRMLLTENKGAEWPLTRKFGCESHMVIDLLIEAKKLGLAPVGVSFHVGSQQTDPQQWGAALAPAAWVFHGCARQGVNLEMVNLGGGLPAHYREPVPPLEAYAEAIETALRKEFASSRPHIMIEPGRYLVGDAGVLRTEIVLIARKSAHEQERWIYLDAGLYNGLDETMNERIHYRIRTSRDGGAAAPAILAGPTCDSTDVLYRRHPYELPLDLEIGDTVDFLSAGAYTASVAAVAFNGFPPIQAYFV